ncbi:hypothetical protein BU16DRAFT_268227 [Lophium mytilinum]|uniref:Uncharacterized protein n=1 Tax=Lophium mytilinum TaxID=390894 RepID=A0A6A6R4D7_9PEZI|nr:hypothetical protein BU16DRAFT_268227 [Lophium mytilinum]
MSRVAWIWMTRFYRRVGFGRILMLNAIPAHRMFFRLGICDRTEDGRRELALRSIPTSVLENLRRVFLRWCVRGDVIHVTTIKPRSCSLQTPQLEAAGNWSQQTRPSNTLWKRVVCCQNHGSSIGWTSGSLEEPAIDEHLQSDGYSEYPPHTSNSLHHLLRTILSITRYFVARYRLPSPLFLVIKSKR